MKRILKLALLIGLISIMCALLLTACECKHKKTEWKITPSQCTVDGKEELCCTKCGEVLETVVIPAAHNHKVLEGYDATCYSQGLTDGIVCVTCKEVVLAQTKLAVVDHTYTNDDDQFCNICGGNRTCAHTDITFNEGTPATCEQPGISSSAFCNDCGMWTIPKIELDPTGHELVYHAKVAPTCIEDGHSAYSHCSKCYEVFEKETIEALGHKDNGYVVVKTPTIVDGTPVNGEMYKVCSVCSVKFDHAYPEYSDSVLAYTVNRDGKSVTIVGIGDFQGTELVIPMFIKGLKVTDIGDFAFKGQTQLTSIILPETLEGIGNYAFADCTGLIEITIPAYVLRIGDGIFDGCTVIVK